MVGVSDRLCADMHFEDAKIIWCNLGLCRIVAEEGLHGSGHWR